MGKQFFVITKISKDEYLQFMEEAGHSNERAYIKTSESGTASIKKDGRKKRWCAYNSTSEEELYVSLKESE